VLGLLSRTRSFFRGLFGRKRFEDGMSDEIRFHIDAYIEDLVRARHAARSSGASRAPGLGAAEGVKEDCREARRLNGVDRLARDMRYASRDFAGKPGFTVVVLLTLALGIGSTIAIFSVVYGVLLKPLPFPESGRIVQVFGSVPARNISAIPFTEANFWDMRDLNQSFEEFGAYHGGSYTLTGSEAPERVSGAQVSVGFFRALGAKPVVGGLFTPGEDDPGASGDRVVLSHAFWTGRFGGDRAIVGRTLTLGGRPYEVIGVLPQGTPWLDRANVFTPFVRQLKADRASWEYTVIGRLKTGVTFEAAMADLVRRQRSRGTVHGQQRSWRHDAALGDIDRQRSTAANAVDSSRSRWTPACRCDDYDRSLV
jgi:putative ABC transport system permease protein